MNKQKKKLTLNKETLCDLTARNAGEVKAGKKGGNGNTKKACATGGCVDSWLQCQTVVCW